MERSAKVKFYDGKLRAVLVSNKSASLEVGRVLPPEDEGGEEGCPF